MRGLNIEYVVLVAAIAVLAIVAAGSAGKTVNGIAENNIKTFKASVGLP